MNRLSRRILPVFLTAAALWFWGETAMIAAKAYVSRRLIASAWERTLVDGGNHKPWPWADTWPAARIEFSGRDSLYILAGSTGASLAFGPGHVRGTALPGTEGAAVVGGHRDTHFARLKDSRIGDTIRVQNQKGRWSEYRIDALWIADRTQGPLGINPEQNALYLVTCYPFGALAPRGSRRFVVKSVKRT